MITKSTRARIRRIGLPSLVLSVVFILCVAIWWTVSPLPGVTLENAHRVRSGMKIEEVQAIFGDPGEKDDGAGGGPFLERVQVWEANGLRIEVVFTKGTRLDFNEPGVNVVNYRAPNHHEWELIEPPHTAGAKIHRWMERWRFW
jgi:hypothetical protein